jgi:hypothetical protein
VDEKEKRGKAQEAIQLDALLLLPIVITFEQQELKNIRQHDMKF